MKTEDIADHIEYLSHKINGFHKDKIKNIFFEQLSLAQQKGLPAYNNDPLWFKESWAYIYPHQIGLSSVSDQPSFDHLTENLNYYEKLGIKVLYLLPHYESPRRDGGYDVSDFLSAAQQFGGNKLFDRFLKECNKRELKVVIDFIPAHVSVEHSWFKKAQEGDSKYINYFIHHHSPLDSIIRKEGLDCYRDYYNENGEFWYSRLLLMPDSNLHHWLPSSVGKNRILYFHSTFFPHQKDLDLQNPDVLEEFLKILGHWISKGVMGIRADAIHRWVKLPGFSGEHMEETFAIAEYFSYFIKMLRPDALFMPELVDVPQRTQWYIGKEVYIQNNKTTSIANALFNFNKSFEIAFASINEDFGSLQNHYYQSENLYTPDCYTDVIYTGIHHDEIYVGLLGAYYPYEGHIQKMRQDLYRYVHENGGVIYKSGNSAACTILDMMGNNVEKLQSYYSFLWGHYGAIAVFQGTELGKRNNYAHLYKKTVEFLEEEMRHGRILNPQLEKEVQYVKEHPEVLETSPQHLENLDLFKNYFDGRLLHRTPVYKEDCVSS